MKTHLNFLFLFFITFNSIAQNEIEPNDDFSTSNQLNICDTIYGSLNSIGDEDYYFINATNSQVVNVELNNVAENIAPVFRFFDVMFKQIVYHGSNGPIATLSFGFTPPDDPSMGFYLIVEAYDSTTVNDQLYQLVISDVTCQLTDIKIYNSETIVFPNPVSGNALVKFSNEFSFSETVLNVYDLTGKELASYSKVKNNSFVDVSNLKSGVLIFEFQNQNNVFYKKVMKK